MLFFSRIVRIAALISAMLLVSLTAFASSPDQVTIRLIKVPANTPANASIYLAGDFNGWNPIDERYRLAPEPQGQYSITLPSGVSSLGKFKLTLGAESDLVGIDDKATGMANRPYFVTESDTGTVYVAVLSWRDKTVEIVRGVPIPFVAKANNGALADMTQPYPIGVLGLGCLIVIPAVYYIRYRRRRAQVLLSALDAAMVTEYQARREKLSEAVATLSADSKELERWSRAVRR